MAQKSQQSQQSQADQQQGEVVRNEDAQPMQVKPTADRSRRDLEADVVNTGDIELGVLDEPEHAADRTSVPGPEYPPADRPPVATTRFDEPVVLSLVTGAGAHMPPDPDVYDPEGRIRDGK
jgi:hypothetical protein